MLKNIALFLALSSFVLGSVDPIFMKAAYNEAPASSIAKVRGLAPNFTATAVVNAEFKQVSLSDYRGKYLVLLFYPLDFTFVCPTELIAFSDRVSEFSSLNTEVVAVSIDSKFTHLAWVNQGRSEGGLGGKDFKIPLVADITKSIARAYGVLIEEGNDAGVALRGLFIINENGVIRHVGVNDLPVGRSVDETLRLLTAFQYSDTHDGEVCPINWKSGDSSMSADPIKSKEYFSKTYSH